MSGQKNELNTGAKNNIKENNKVNKVKMAKNSQQQNITNVVMSFSVAYIEYSHDTQLEGQSIYLQAIQFCSD